MYTYFKGNIKEDSCNIPLNIHDPYMILVPSTTVALCTKLGTLLVNFEFYEHMTMKNGNYSKVPLSDRPYARPQYSEFYFVPEHSRPAAGCPIPLEMWIDPWDSKEESIYKSLDEYYFGRGTKLYIKWESPPGEIEADIIYALVNPREPQKYDGLH